MPKVIFEINASQAVFVESVGAEGIPIEVSIRVEGVNSGKQTPADHLCALLHKSSPMIIKAISDIYLDELRSKVDPEAKINMFNGNSFNH